jgi:ferrous iron transport protein B
MSTRTIPDRRERLATILVAPFMTCSARLPVYVLLTGLLFPDSPAKAALAFVACYALGIAAGVISALIARRTILRGPARPMAIELPSYKLPSLRTALLTTYDRGLTFIKNAGTNILCICLVLWWLGAFPRVEPPAKVIELRAQAAQVQGAAREELTAQADHLEHTHAKGQSFIGQIGRTVQPVFSPLGFDWQLSVGVMASFAAREVFVGTMSILVAGEEKSDENATRITDQLRSARRDGGKRLIFDGPTSWALLVYYVLAMQCLPTLVVTAKESGSYKWAFVQLAWMSALAYVAGAIVYALARAWGA